ncbi:MAG TPA: efflux RND transporter periplasmic adaptor subunit [Acidobacteriaceae bacterium]|nr:efflux RND transporter periplasmic adaptor subunit [Acidobacteriaceae bacterium]
MATKTSRHTARIWMLTVVALILAFYLVRMATREKLPIRVATATIGDLKKTSSTNGKVEPEPQANFEAHAPFPGVIRAVYVHSGETVPAGKLLLAMDDTQAKEQVANAWAALRGAQANYAAALHGGTPSQLITLIGNLQKAKIERDQAQRDLEALQQLEATGAASPSEVSAAQQRLAADNSTLHVLEQQKKNGYGSADIAHAQAALEDAQAAYAAARDALRQAIVHAPFAGTVYSLPVSPTDYVQQGDRLLSLADLNKLQVLAYFDEPEIGDLQVGQPVTIVWDARPSQVWHGHIVRLPSTIITYGTRNVGEVLVSLEDAAASLLPDTNVRVTVTVANESNVLVIPRDALYFEQGAPYVYRVADGSLHRARVTLGKNNLIEMQIVRGLRPGDVVATGTTNGQPLGDGQPVTIVQ